MKKLLLLISFLLIVGCNSDKGWNCVQTSGSSVEQEIPLPEFDKILVWDKIKFFIQQGNEQKIVVKTGKNLLHNIHLSVENSRLEIRNENTCNWFRDYENVEVYVTSPNISEIRSSTGYEIESIGILRYASLVLVSEDSVDAYHTDGDFNLTLDVEELKIVANGRSAFTLSGKAQKADFGLYSGDGRIYAENLIVEDINFFHRSTGPIVVNPQQSLKGKIVSLGDVISKNQPEIVEVEELYRGRLIFE